MCFSEPYTLTSSEQQSNSSLMLDIRYVFLGALHFDILRATVDLPRLGSATLARGDFDGPTLMDRCLRPPPLYNFPFLSHSNSTSPSKLKLVFCDNHKNAQQLSVQGSKFPRSIKFRPRHAGCRQKTPIGATLHQFPGQRPTVVPSVISTKAFRAITPPRARHAVRGRNSRGFA
ncbi:hypothetical protein RRG08_032180 [Elysia crispata]|uniref:Uncharacterized protein n=1 Tax=Elysia crispata TaxID=231223 RepID=A0AAE1DVY4_9GAST|nr:hypothetical protein RRG08_032180 [Elysia crispata]